MNIASKKLDSFKDLSVWQKAEDLAVIIYSVTGKFPVSELYGLANQMRRAVVSISSNIAEGFKRTHKKEKTQFYSVAHASAAELESQTEISRRLGFLADSDYGKCLAATEEVSKMVNGLIKSLNPQSSILNSRKGFTLVETIVAIGVFTIVAGIAVGGLVDALQSQRRIASLIEAENNVSLVMEQIAREIRTGYNFCQDVLGVPTCTAPGELTFVNASVAVVTYRLRNGAIERQADSGAPFVPITSSKVFVQYLNFVLLGNNKGDNWPPRITVAVGISPVEQSIAGIVADLQTTVSARQLDT